MAHQDRTDAMPTQQAWGHIADGYAAAMWTEGLCDVEMSWFAERYRHALVRSGRFAQAWDGPVDFDGCPLRAGGERLWHGITDDPDLRVEHSPGGLFYLLPAAYDGNELVGRCELRRALSRAGLHTIEQVQAAVDDGSIINVKGIGPKRLELLLEALDEYDAGERG